MSAPALRRDRQRGATLIVALIMLAIITLVVIGGFTLSTSNLKSVGNMLVREEAVAAGREEREVPTPMVAENLSLEAQG